MATKYISGRVKELKIGITSYSENRDSLTVIGNAGIGTENPTDPANSSNTSLLSAGIVTAYKFYGDGSNLSGVGNTANITAESLVVTGITTLGSVEISSGIITSTSGIVTYIGDGSQLTGVGNTANITAQTLVVVGFSTLGVTSTSDLTAKDLKVTGVSTFIGDIDANGSLDVDGHTELDEVNIAGVATFGNNIDANGNLDVDGHTELDNLRVSGVSTYVGLVDINGGIDVSGMSTFSSDVYLGNHYMDAVVFNGTIKSDLEPWSSDVYDLGGGANNFKWRHLSLTGNAGIGSLNVTGITTLSGLVELGSNLNVVGISTFDLGIDIPDSSLSTLRALNLGDDKDLKIYYLAGHGYIYNETGDLLLTNVSTGGDIRLWTKSDINLEPGDGDDGVKVIGGGAVELYHNNILRFSTSGIGVSVAGIGSTAYIEGPENIVIDPHPVGGGATSGSVHIKGDLYVDGTEFIVDVDKIELGDFQIGIATTAGTNILLDGAGIGIGSESIRKYITWSNASSSLKSSENWNLASGKHYEIDGTDVLTSNTLGSGIVNSSLTSVGTLGELFVSGISTLGVGYATSITTSKINLNGNLVGDNGTWITGVYGLEAVEGTFSGNINANGNIVGDNSTNISGINSVTATEFYGNGSGLTDIDVSRWASNATGIHTLTNVGVGTTTVTGAASPSNTTVLNAGIVTANYFYGDGSELTGISVSRWASNATGIHTLTNVGIGTTTVTGVASTTNTTVLNAGIVTANYFYGSGIGLTGTDWAQVNNNLFAGNFAGQYLQSPASFGNVFIGEEAGRLTTTGDHNISVGYRSGLGNCTGSNNVSLGQRSGYYTNGSYNLFFGTRTGYWNSTGNCNIMAGYEAGYYNSTGINNIYLGKNSGKYGSVGSYNIFLGFCAGFSGGGSNNCHNVILGSCAGVAHTNGSYNIFLGERASSCSTTGSNNIAIGSTVQLPLTDGNDQLAIGQGSNYWINGDSDFNVGIGTTIPTSKFNVQGTSNFNGGVGIADSIFHLDNIDTAIRFPSDNVITFETSGDEKLRVVAGNVGIGTQVPTDQVQASNTSILAVGIVTAYKLYSTVYGEFQGSTVIADNIVGGGLSISGISTLGSVEISSGIITSTSGIVTYYGDGSQLTGINSDQFTNINVGFLTVTNTAEFSGIATVTGNTLFTKQLSATGISTFQDGIHLLDGAYAKFGNDNDLLIGHEYGFNAITIGSTVYLSDSSTNNRVVLNDNGILEFKDTSGTTKLEVNNTGLDVTGVSTFSGNINANGNIVGDNSTNITGIYDLEVQNDLDIIGDIVGSPGNSNISGINSVTATGFYGDGSELTGISAGLWVSNSAGIHTSSKVGIGTTNPMFDLDVGSYVANNVSTAATIRIIGENNSTAIRIGPGGTTNDITLIRVDSKDGTTDGSGNTDLGHSLKYMGSGSGVDNRLAFWVDNTSNTAYEAVSIYNDGKFVVDGNPSAGGHGFYGTPSDAFTVRGSSQFDQINVTGVVTATSFYGDGSNLTGTGLWVSNSTGIHTSSNIGIGTTNASHAAVNIDVGTATTALVVEGSEGQLFSVTNSLTSGSIFSVNDISGIPSIDVDADGTIQLAPYGTGEMVGVGTTNPTSKLHVIGDTFITGVVTATDVDSTSDIRLKTNIQPIDNPLAKVIQIEGVSFNWKQDNRPALGVIADQVEKILPQLVHGDDPKTVNYNGLIGLLIEAVKEQQSEIDTLKERISKLE